MANTNWRNGFRPVGNAKISYFEVAGSQTFKVGDPVYLSSGGLVTIATTSTDSLCGIAAQDCASLAASTLVAVWADPEQIFEGQCAGTGTGATAVYTCATAGSCYDMTTTNGTGDWEINESASTEDNVKVVGIGTDPATGQTSADGANQRLRFKIHPESHQLAGVD